MEHKTIELLITIGATLVTVGILFIVVVALIALWSNVLGK